MTKQLQEPWGETKSSLKLWSKEVTHMESVQVHLDLVQILLENGDNGNGFFLCLKTLDDLWETIVSKTVPEVHSVFFDWLADNYVMFLPRGKEKVVEKLVLYTGPRSASYHRLSVIFGE